MSETLWMIAYERIGEEFASRQIDEPEARARMRKLGFDPNEIDEHIDVLMEDRSGEEN